MKVTQEVINQDIALKDIKWTSIEGGISRSHIALVEIVSQYHCKVIDVCRANKDFFWSYLLCENDSPSFYVNKELLGLINRRLYDKIKHDCNSKYNKKVISDGKRIVDKLGSWPLNGICFISTF